MRSLASALSPREIAAISSNREPVIGPQKPNLIDYYQGEAEGRVLGLNHRQRASIIAKVALAPSSIHSGTAASAARTCSRIGN